VRIPRRTDQRPGWSAAGRHRPDSRLSNSRLVAPCWRTSDHLCARSHDPIVDGALVASNNSLAHRPGASRRQCCPRRSASNRPPSAPCCRCSRRAGQNAAESRPARPGRSARPGQRPVAVRRSAPDSSRRSSPRPGSTHAMLALRTCPSVLLHETPQQGGGAGLGEQVVDASVGPAVVGGEGPHGGASFVAGTQLAAVAARLAPTSRWERVTGTGSPRCGTAAGAGSVV